MDSGTQSREQTGERQFVWTGLEPSELNRTISCRLLILVWNLKHSTTILVTGISGSVEIFCESAKLLSPGFVGCYRFINKDSVLLPKALRNVVFCLS